MGMVILCFWLYSILVGLIPPEEAFDGFKEKTVWLVVCAFFISIGYFDTHREYVKKISENFNPNWIRPPELFFDNKQMREDMAKFYSSLEKIDKGIGKIYDTLKEKKKFMEFMRLTIIQF